MKGEVFLTLIIGLTGGIASGKSTVSKIIKEMGYLVIDADIEARNAVEVGESAYKKIIDLFGEEVLLPDRTINRSKLGEIIFHDKSKREQLNKIVHPDVRKRMNQKKDTAIKRGDKLVVLDIPLLFESGLKSMVDLVLLVYVDEKIQLQRLMNRNHLTEEEALARIGSQMPIKDKLQLADSVIDNNGTEEETKRQVIELIKKWNAIT